MDMCETAAGSGAAGSGSACLRGGGRGRTGAVAIPRGAIVPRATQAPDRVHRVRVRRQRQGLSTIRVERDTPLLELALDDAPSLLAERVKDLGGTEDGAGLVNVAMVPTKQLATWTHIIGNTHDRVSGRATRRENDGRTP